MNRTRQHLAFLAATCAALAGTPAFADTVEMKTTTHGHQWIDTSLTGVEAVAQFVAERNGQTFYTYCTDVWQPFNFNVAYTEYFVAPTDSANGFTQRQANLLGNLYAVADNGHTAIVDTLDETVGFQLAVWEIMNETSGHLTVSMGADQGLFYVESGATDAQVALANKYLSEAEATDQSTFTVTRLASKDHQDMMLVQEVSAVPEPSTYAMILAGLAVMGTVAKRRKPAR